MKKKVNCTLLVDDDMVSNYISERLIRSMDITNQIKMAPNGEEALKYLEEFEAQEHTSPELIFLDINMPVMDAFDFISLYRNIYDKSSGKIVVLTTSNHPDDIEKLTEYGVADFINKPLTTEKLKLIIDKYFE